MHPLFNTLLKVDPTNLDPSIIQGLADGSMEMSPTNGTVRHATGELKGRLVKHLKLIPVTPEDLANPQQMLQLATTVASAAVVIGVVVIATTYLAGKIDSVQRSVDAIGGAITQQDLRENLRIATGYTGAVSAARELVASNAAASATNVASRLIEARHGSLAYIEGLRRLLDRPDVPAGEMDRSLGLMIRLLDLMPAAMQVEKDLGLMIGDHGLVENAAHGPVAEYRRQLSEFKHWCEALYLRMALGEGGPAEILRKHRPALQQLFDSPINEFMLASLGARSTAADGRASSGTASPLEALFESVSRIESRVR